MDTRKFIVKIAYGLNIAVITILVGLLVYQQHIIRRMSDNKHQVPQADAVSDLNTLSENNTQATTMAKARVEQLAAKAETLRYQLAATEEELGFARGDLATIKEKMYEDDQESIDMLKRELENPTLMERRLRGTEYTIVNNYGAFFERLGLSDEKMRNLKALMVDNRMETNFLNELLGHPSLPDEDRKELQQQLEDQEAEFEKQARELLGADNYEAYIAYEERRTDQMPERGSIDELFRSQGVDLDLSDEKKQELIDAMSEARKDVEAKYPGVDLWATWQPDSPNFGEQIGRLIELNDAYSESGRRVLSGSQAELFETMMNLDKERLKVRRSVLGGGDDESY